MTTGPAATAHHRPIRVSAVGDVMLGRDVGRHFAESPGDFAMPDIRAVVQSSDIVLANLECPIAAAGRPDPKQDPQVTFRAAPATIDVLRTLGVTVVSLGNNHALDYGDEALAETLDRLDAAGIGRAGAGRTDEEANAPHRVRVGDRRVSILSTTFAYSVNTRMAGRKRPGVADHRIDRLVRIIRALKGAGDTVIVSCHWGFEYRLYPLPYQMRQAREMIRAGASLVLGHGPHYPQGIERYRDRDIVYSLGNFVFDEPFALARRSFVYSVDIAGDGRTTDRTVTPVRLVHHVPEVSTGATARRMQRLVELLSEAYPRAGRSFWHELSADYLMELGGRTLRGRSLKYLRVPPASFYRDASPAALRALEPRRLARGVHALLGRAPRAVTAAGAPTR